MEAPQLLFFLMSVFAMIMSNIFYQKGKNFSAGGWAVFAGIFILIAGLLPSLLESDNNMNNVILFMISAGALLVAVLTELNKESHYKKFAAVFYFLLAVYLGVIFL